MQRERCPFAVLGQATADGRLVPTDSHFGNRPIDMPLALLLGKPPKMLRRAERVRAARTAFLRPPTSICARRCLRVLRLPAVADKTFLITIGDRTVTGLVRRDQMVGPWQVPVADAAVTTTSYDGYTGEAMAMGERTPLALLDAAASARMAVGEALTNIASAPIAKIGDVKLSANWMAAAGHPGEDARLYEAVRAVGMRAGPALGIAIPVGKDSMSMSTVWHEGGQEKRVTAPLSLIVSAFAPVTDVRRALDAAASVGPGRHRVAPRGSRHGPPPPGRLGVGAGLRPAWRRGARPRRSRGAEDLLRNHPTTEQQWPVAGVPRPFRRWPSGHAAGDGLRGRMRAGDGSGRACLREPGPRSFPKSWAP